MRVLFDIGHPAHVHFFRQPMRLLVARGHEIMVTSRRKEIAVDLLDELGIEHEVLSAEGAGGLRGLAGELVQRDVKLYRHVRRHAPDVMAGIGGIFIAHVGLVTGIPSLVFYDTENARLQNALTYPFAHRLFVPRCYGGWTPTRRTERYAGYHELSYLHPGYFVPSRAVAEENGLAREGDTFVLRLVSWKANHDIGEHGWSVPLLRQVVATLAAHGRVLISSEAQLPPEFSAWIYRGRPGQIHHVMAFARGLVGESATMASESAVLGVPAIYAAQTGRGYTDEQETRYGLVRNVRRLDWGTLSDALEWLLSLPRDEACHRRERLLADTIDVAAFVAGSIEVAALPVRAAARA